MAKRRHYRRRTKETPELDVTTFLNLMVILVPFLLITAVFSRVTILELSVPTASGGGAVNKPDFSIEVIVRDSGLEFANGAKVVAAIPKKQDEYDLQKLSDMLVSLKDDYPQKQDATVLVEPDIEYDHLIQVMDAVRVAEIPEEGTEDLRDRVLFPKISIGDAP